MTNFVKDIEAYEKEAFDMLHEAAENGNEFAQLYLGYCYSYGVGTVSKIDKDNNDEKAEKWLRKASEQGNEQAQHHLGLVYLSNGNEEGLKRLVEKARDSYSLAMDRLSCYRSERDSINGEQNPQNTETADE